MKLLLDVHHSPVAARVLRSRGYDVESAVDDPNLAGLGDEDLLRVARDDGRVLVTEDVKDFHRIVTAWAAKGEHHAGVIFTSARRFPRSRLSYPNDLIEALTRRLIAPPESLEDWADWLA